MLGIEGNNMRKGISAIAVAGSVVACVGALGLIWFAYHPDPVDSSIRPRLKLHTQKYMDQKLLGIINIGLGPAVITQAQFCRAEVCTSNVAELFDLDVVWDIYSDLPSETSIAPNEEHILMKLNFNEAQGKTFERLEDWQRQKTGIRVIIHYEDIEGNRYGPLITTLK